MDDDQDLTPRRPAARRDPAIRSTRGARASAAATEAGDAPASPPPAAAPAPAPEPAPALPPDGPPRLEAVQRDRVAADERRRQLWRDSATILIGVIVALLVGQTLFPAPVAAPAGSATPLPSGIVIGTVGPPASLPPGATFGPIIDPSIAIDATPTPIPVITMGPSPSPSPSPTPSPGPTASRRPSPSPKPPTPPPATPTPPPATPTPPAPTPGFTYNAVFLTVDFTDTSTGTIDSWSWAFGDGGTSSAQNPSHTYVVAEQTIFSVTLTVSGPGGSDSIVKDVTVSPGP